MGSLISKLSPASTEQAIDLHDLFLPLAFPYRWGKADLMKNFRESIKYLISLEELSSDDSWFYLEKYIFDIKMNYFHDSDLFYYAVKLEQLLLNNIDEPVITRYYHSCMLNQVAWHFQFSMLSPNQAAYIVNFVLGYSEVRCKYVISQGAGFIKAFNAYLERDNIILFMQQLINQCFLTGDAVNLCFDKTLLKILSSPEFDPRMHISLGAIYEISLLLQVVLNYDKTLEVYKLMQVSDSSLKDSSAKFLEYFPWNAEKYYPSTQRWVSICKYTYSLPVSATKLVFDILKLEDDRLSVVQKYIIRHMLGHGLVLVFADVELADNLSDLLLVKYFGKEGKAFDAKVDRVLAGIAKARQVIDMLNEPEGDSHQPYLHRSAYSYFGLAKAGLKSDPCTPTVNPPVTPFLSSVSKEKGVEESKSPN